MKPKRLYTDFIDDIVDAIQKVDNFIEGMTLEQFLADEKTSFAVIRALEIIGEATKNIPQTIKENYPDIPWKEMAGIRDKLIHDYFGVDLEVVWNTATEDLLELKEKIDEALTKSKNKQ